MTRSIAETVTSATIEKELKGHTLRLMQLGAFGLLALVLGPFGELSLSRSSPIFGYLGLTYGAWQMCYFFGLTILAVAWLAAVAQRLNLLSECRTRRDMRLRLEAERQAKQRALKEAKEAREARAKEMAALIRPGKRAGSFGGKFDY